MTIINWCGYTLRIDLSPDATIYESDSAGNKQKVGISFEGYSVCQDDHTDEYDLYLDIKEASLTLTFPLYDNESVDNEGDYYGNLEEADAVGTVEITNINDGLNYKLNINKNG